MEDTTAPHHHDTYYRNLTQEGYLVVFLLSSEWGPEGFAPIPLSGDLACEGQAAAQEVLLQSGFSDLCVFLVFCGLKGF